MATETLTQALYEKGTLIAVRVSRWTGQKKITKKDLLLDDTLNDHVIYPGHMKLLPPEAGDDVSDIEYKARKLLAAVSVPFLGFDGIRYVKLDVLPGVLKELPELREKFDASVESLIKMYPDLKKKQLDQIDKQLSAIALEALKKAKPENYAARELEVKTWHDKAYAFYESCYPDDAKLKKSFQFSWRAFQLVPNQAALDVVGAESSGALDSDLQEWMKTTAAETHMALGDAVANAKELLASKTTLPPRSLKPLYEALQQFVAQDLTESSPYKEAIQNLLKQFHAGKDGPNYEAMSKSLSLDSVRYTFNESLASLSPLALQSTAEQAGKDALMKAEAFSRLVTF